MSDPRPAYWAVIPAELRRDENLPANAKLLYGDISALTSERGYCFAGNEYLAGLYGWTERSVQRLIAALAGRGYIRVEMVPGKERRIYAGAFLGPPRTSPPEGGDKNVTPDKKVVRGATKLSPPNNVDIDSGNIPPHPPRGGTDGKSYFLPLKDGTSYEVTRAEIERLRERFPAVDVEQQFRSMLTWLEASPDNRKTRRGIGRFIASWLSRRADKVTPQRPMTGGIQEGGEGYAERELI